MKNNSNLEFKGKSDFQVKYIILEDGTKLDINDIAHVLILKARKNNKEYEFCLSQNVKQKNDYKALSNQAFLMANVLKIMALQNVDFGTATKIHIEYMDKLIERKNNA
jgi:hypothetical protein